MRLKNNQDLWLECLDLSLQCIEWLYKDFSKNKRKPLISVSYNNNIIGPNQSHAEPLIAARKHPWVNVCDEQKSKPLLSDDLSGSPYVCEAVWMKINWRNPEVKPGHIYEQRAIDFGQCVIAACRGGGCHSYILELTVHPSNWQVKAIHVRMRFLVGTCFLRSYHIPPAQPDCWSI